VFSKICRRPRGLTRKKAKREEDSKTTEEEGGKKSETKRIIARSHAPHKKGIQKDEKGKWNERVGGKR